MSERAARGEGVIIAKAGKPMARLVPMQVGERKPGRLKGKIRIAADFDAPLPRGVLDDFESGEPG